MSQPYRRRQSGPKRNSTGDDVQVILNENSTLIVELLNLQESLKHITGTTEASEITEIIKEKRQELNKNLTLLAKWADEATDESPDLTDYQPVDDDDSDEEEDALSDDEWNTTTTKRVQRKKPKTQYSNKTGPAQPLSNFIDIRFDGEMWNASLRYGNPIKVHSLGRHQSKPSALEAVKIATEEVRRFGYHTPWLNVGNEWRRATVQNGPQTQLAKTQDVEITHEATTPTMGEGPGATTTNAQDQSAAGHLNPESVEPPKTEISNSVSPVAVTENDEAVVPHQVTLMKDSQFPDLTTPVFDQNQNVQEKLTGFPCGQT